MTSTSRKRRYPWRLAVITGAASGIGRCFSEALAADGCRLLLIDRNEIAQLEGYGSTGEQHTCDLIQTLRLDLTDADAPDRVMSYLDARGLNPDLLINNAGIAWMGLLTDMSVEEWNRMISTNLSSAFYCCRAALPYMIHQKAGRIINISSMWGTVGASCEVAYSAAKSGLNGLTRALAKELAPSNIQVNAIACGVIDTVMNDLLDAEEKAALAEEIPAGRFGTPEEVALLAWQLANAPAYLTGQILGMDGG